MELRMEVILLQLIVMSSFTTHSGSFGKVSEVISASIEFVGNMISSFKEDDEQDETQSSNEELMTQLEKISDENAKQIVHAISGQSQYEQLQRTLRNLYNLETDLQNIINASTEEIDFWLSEYMRHFTDKYMENIRYLPRTLIDTSPGRASMIETYIKGTGCIKTKVETFFEPILELGMKHEMMLLKFKNSTILVNSTAERWEENIRETRTMSDYILASCAPPKSSDAPKLALNLQTMLSAQLGGLFLLKEYKLFI